jgi:hypothetical protein
LPGCAGIARNKATEGGAALYVYNGGADEGVSLDACILALNTGSSSLDWAGVGAAPALTCCDIFALDGNHFGGAWPDVIGVDGNFSAYPFFCGTGSGDEHSFADFSFELQANSPCLPGGNACGILIGPFGEGCAASGANGLDEGASAHSSLVLPNPFAEGTRIRAALPGMGRAILRIYDVAGRKLRELSVAAGAGDVALEFAWDGRDSGGRPAPSGVYTYRIEREGRQLSGRMTKLR